jgi:hypothetical protein
MLGLSITHEMEFSPFFGADPYGVNSPLKKWRFFYY